MYNSGVLSAYVELVGMEYEPVLHEYKLKTVFGVVYGADLVVMVHRNIQRLEISYSNELGLNWEQIIDCDSYAMGGGVSPIPISANVESSLDGEEFNAGSAATLTYFSPAFFASSRLTADGVELVAGAGAGVSTMTFHSDDDSIVFDTSGMVVRAGTNVVGDASVSVSYGSCSGEVAVVFDLGPLDEHPEILPEGTWEPVVGARVYFETGISELDADDHATLDAVVDHMLQREREVPGSRFRICIVGSASRLGEEEFNAQLSVQRAASVRAALEGQVLALHVEWDPGTVEESTITVGTRPPAGEDSTDNRQEDRQASIYVFYNDCSISAAG